MASPSSDRMNFSNCFANKIFVGPRLPFATRTTFRSAPKVYAIKFISTYQILWHPDSFVYRDKVNRVASRLRRLADGALFFARHLDYFIVTQNSQPSPGLGTVTQLHRDPWLLCHLPGLAKNEAPRPFATALGRLRRQLIKPPGR